MSAILLHLLRHGRPLRTGLLLGHRDEPAAPGAHEALLDRVSDLAFDRLVTSDLRRAREGAEEIARARGVALHGDPRWRELDFGAWDGLEADAMDSADMTAFWSNPDTAAPPGGERWSDLCARVAAAIGMLDTSTLVVTHAGAMRAALALLTGLDHRTVWCVDLPYGALLSLRLWPAATPNDRIEGQIVGLRT